MRRIALTLMLALLLGGGCLRIPKPQLPPAKPPATPTTPTTPEAPTTPATPTEMTVHVQVSNTAGKGLSKAVVRLHVSRDPEAWVTGETGQDGHATLRAPASLTDSHLEATADGHLPLSMHVDVSAGVTLTVRLTPKPVHADWPADPAAWFPFRCDITGVREPEIQQYGRTPVVSSWIVPLYPEALRQRIYASHRARGYTHFVIDPVPKYGDWYPSGHLSVDRFRETIHELLDAGLKPVIFWIGDHLGRDIDAWKRLVDPYLDYPEIRRLAKLGAVGWETNEWMRPADFYEAVRYLRGRLAPDARLFVHMTPDHAAMCEGDGCEAPWWRRMADENLLDGIFLQLQPYATLEEQIDRAKDFTTRLVGGINGWPTRRADGRPLQVIAFEYDAYPQTRERMTEDEGRARGAALAAIPGMSGFCDGGFVKQ